VPQHNEEAKIAKEVEAHERRIRKELEKQDILRRKVPARFNCWISADINTLTGQSCMVSCLCREKNKCARKWREMTVKGKRKRRDFCVKGKERKRGYKGSKGGNMSAWRSFYRSNLDE
jgi:hypothetical protein